MPQWMRDFAFTLVFVLAFLVSWLGQYLTQPGEPLASDFWNATLENWQSEFLQVAAAAFVGELVAKRKERMQQAQMDRIERKLNRPEVLIRDRTDGD